MFYLRYVCWFVYSGVQHILCCAFEPGIKTAMFVLLQSVVSEEDIV